MSYQINHNLNKIDKPDRQSGVSLMLAVLVLSAITAIAFSLATIVFIEIRSSSDAARTEPTLYGAFGVTEEALFQYKRFVEDASYNVASCPSQSNNICSINGVTLQLPGTQPIAFDDNTRVEFVESGITKTIPMYYAGCFEKLYNDVSLQVLPNATSSSIKFYFKITDSNGNISYSPSQPLTYTATTASAYLFNQFSSGQWELVFDNTTGPDLNVSIYTTRASVPSACTSVTSAGNGLPFVGEEVLRIRATYQGLSRNYQVRIPIP